MNWIMPKIILETKIQSCIGVCFDLSRSIDLHIISTEHTKETAIGGRIKGLIGLNECVTWEAVPFGIRQKLTTKVTAFLYPYHFKDEQQKEAFKSMVHDHFFEEHSDGTVIMKDVFEFESPLGILGKLFNHFVLTNYLKNLLVKRNNVLKDAAESEKWKKFLKS